MTESKHPITTFKVLATDETDLDVIDDLLGRGVQFPSGRCVVSWHLAAFPEGERLEHPHISQYGCLADVEQGSGGKVLIGTKL